MRSIACRIAIAGISMLLLASSAWAPAAWAPSAWAQQWTRFHGPNGTGVSETKSIPAQWTEGDYNWKVAIPGIGHSSPVVWGDRIFLLSADPETAQRFVVCYHTETGRKLWQRDYSSKAHHLHKFSSYASCTPAVDEQRVYFAWSTPDQTLLIALDHQGRDVWQKDIGRWQSQHGFGTSPMLYKDLLILNNSQQAARLNAGEQPGESFVIALNKATGEERWRTPRASVNVCYSVPCIYRPEGGAPQLICTNTGDGMFSLDPDTGKPNWAIDVFKMRTVSTPLIVGDVIFGSTGSGGGGNYVVAIQAGKQPKELYRVERSAPYVPSSVAYGELVFLWGDGGLVTCVDARTGKVHWGPERVPGDYFSSPVRAGDKIYCVNADGEVIVLAASKQFRQLGRNPLGEPSRSTPAISGGRMFLRTYSHLISIGAKSL